MNVPLSPELVPQAPEAPSSRDGTGAPSPAEETLAQVCRLLRLWSAGDAPGPEQDCTALLGWLEANTEAVAGCMLPALIEGFELYRRDQWLHYAASIATVWGRWTGGELERPTYEVSEPASAASNRLRLRRATPFGPPEVAEFLTAFADAEEARRLQDRKAALLRGTVLDVLHEAICRVRGTSTDGDALLGPLHRLHHKHKGEQIRASALRLLELLDQPSPPGLRECLRQLLAPAEEVGGCLTRAYRVRLFRHVAEMAAPLIPLDRFEPAAAAVETLRGQVELPAADPATLREVCGPLGELGRFARRVRPVLAGPAAREHRAWARSLLDNFERLGELACCLLGEALPPLVELGPPSAEEDDPASSIPVSAVTIAPPEPEPPRKEPSPEEAALAALAINEPAAEHFLAIAALAEELSRAVQGSWRDAEEALKSLQYPGNRFRQKLLRAAQAPAEDQGRKVLEAARQLADEFVNKIRRLDALLPRSGACPPPFKGPAQFAPPAREQVGQKLKALRDRVFHVMRAYGGYEEYQVAIGDSVRQHGQVLDEVTYVSGPRLRPDEIVQILEPGYVRRREDGKQELIRSPKVLVAR
jgi:hypothetical protein